MHTLCRQIRFSIDPFASSQPEGYNSYASKPAGGGLSLYFSLWITLKGRLDPKTGFVINVSKIDKIVRQSAVPLFVEAVGACFAGAGSMTEAALAHLLDRCAGVLRPVFRAENNINLESVRLDLNPYRAVLLSCGPSDDQENAMLCYTEKFEFSAMHKLWNEQFTREQNFEAFGKCANPAGHGHNYILEVTVQRPEPSDASNWHINLEKTVAEEFLDHVDHKNLNQDLPDFTSLNPTVENLARLAWQKLTGKFENAVLRKVTVWENDRTCCSYSE